MPEGKKPAEDLYSAKTHLHQPVPEVSTVNATALPADAPEGALPSEVRPEIVTWEKLCEAIKASGKAYNMEMITKMIKNNSQILLLAAFALRNISQNMIRNVMHCHIIFCFFLFNNRQIMGR